MTEVRPVAIDARILAGQPAGKGRYVLGLLEGLRAQAPDRPLIIYSSVELPFPRPQHWQLVFAPPSLRGAWWLVQDAAARGASGLLAPTSFSVAVFSKLPAICVVHDLAVFRCPEAKPHWTTWLPERVFLATALRRVRHVLAVSNFTKTELTAAFGVAADRITVAPNGVDASFQPRGSSAADMEEVRRRYRLPAQFILFVGTLEPRKNLLRLFQAFADLPLELKKTYPLVIVGKVGWSAGPIRAGLARLEDQRWAHYLDYLPSSDLPHLYRLATMVAYPSLYEGFGLPALEALASGRPLLTANTTALPEVVGNAALTIDPTDIMAIRQGLADLLTKPDLRQKLSECGPLEVKRYTWEKTGAIVDQVFRTYFDR